MSMTSLQGRAKQIYKVLRSILFSAIAVGSIIYILLYVALTIPSIQNHIKNIASHELSKLLTTEVEIGNLDIIPFNELRLSEVKIDTPDGNSFIKIKTLGAGLSLMELIFNQNIRITYVEIIGLEGNISQEIHNGKYNFQFLIDAFASKDKNTPPVQFKLDIRNIVLRKSSIIFDRTFIPRLSDSDIRTDFNHLKLTNLSADIAIPFASNDSVDIDLRRLKFHLDPELDVKKIAFKLQIGKNQLNITDFNLSFPSSKIDIANLHLQYSSLKDISEILQNQERVNLTVLKSNLTPYDFRSLFPILSNFRETLDFDTKLGINRTGIYIDTLNLSSRSYINNYGIYVRNFIFSTGNNDFIDNEKRDVNLNGVVSMEELRLETGNIPTTIVSGIPQNSKFSEIQNLTKFDNLSLKIGGKYDLNNETGYIAGEIKSQLGKLLIDINCKKENIYHHIYADLNGNSLSLPEIKNTILPLTGDFDIKIQTDACVDLKRLFSPLRHSNSISGVIADISSRIPELHVLSEIPTISLVNSETMGIALNIDKNGEMIDLAFKADGNTTDVALDITADTSADTNYISLNSTCRNFKPSLFNKSIPIRDITAQISSNISFNDLDDLQGSVEISGWRLTQSDGSNTISLPDLILTSNIDTDSVRNTTISCDWLNGEIHSTTPLRKIPDNISGMLHKVSYLIGKPCNNPKGSIDFALTLSKNIPWYDLGFNSNSLPVKPLYDITLGGELDFGAGNGEIIVEAPYLQQDRDKLIRETGLKTFIRNDNATIRAHSIIPTKKGELDFNAGINVHETEARIDLNLNPGSHGKFYGDINLNLSYTPSINSDGNAIIAHFYPTSLWLNNIEWKIGEADIEYADNRIKVNNFSIGNQDQFVTISGLASSSKDDCIEIELSDIDLDYIFETLNINYVTFGGTATGVAIAKGLFSTQPIAHTKHLSVKDLSYNHCVLGDGELKGDYNFISKRIGIGASINEAKRNVANIDGGIWIGRDSLSFGIEADKVRIGFLQTFMQAFSSHVDGRASGRGKLYGTFKDIDMIGDFFADSIAVKVDYTNTVYSGRDSVRMSPGVLEIPKFKIKDINGKTANLTGELRHRYFHEPYFNFRITDAESILVYDTNPKMNPIWYGRIFGSGSGAINGSPSMVEIVADMMTEAGSEFTFVLDDRLEAEDFDFLTFTDSRKERLVALNVTEDTDSFITAFNKKIQQQTREESAGFAMNIRATITPDVKLTMIMDPVAGDRITARGEGPMNITYTSEGNEMKMYGRYTLEEGKYNFTLQDIILKDFIIKPGSSVSFNGDPMNAQLDIKAAYRVNTNLTDLDESFAMDRELNRTNVPVDAMLMVKGDMTSPWISFDIEFPTLDEEVSRKVRSIISSEDMMNRQMIYLLALNRFYSPEYMGNNGNGGEWASITSSTLSSQLQNILGRLTDKVSVAPTFRSDKGDFSDLEVDVALSSQLFNNRLLINGNLGYRDKATSNTTFVGDFDVEYLLTRNGNLRLKAYNHFNDQNYYLKSALTTQGLGVIFKKDFGSLLPVRKKKVKVSDKNINRKSEKRDR